MNLYGEIYTLLDDIKAMYSHAGDEEMYALAYVCENLVTILEFLGNDQPTVFSDVYNFLLSYVHKMNEIAHNDILDELYDCVVALNLE